MWVTRMSLVTPHTGWAAGSGKLVVTSDGGAHWRDITPPQMFSSSGAPLLAFSTQLIQVFFFDPRHGWILSRDIGSDDPNLAPSFLLTTDGGRHWTRAHFPSLSGHDFTVGGSFSFIDPDHGWLTLFTASEDTILLQTSNAGRTWSIVQIYGGSLQIRATSERDIWALRGSHAFLPVVQVSHNGGKSFQPVAFPAPPQAPRPVEAFCTLPLFTSRLNGYEEVLYFAGPGSNPVVALFVTSDGGRSWHPGRVLTNSSNPDGLGVPPHYTVTGHLWTFASKTTPPHLLQVPAVAGVTDIPGDNLHDYAFGCALSFASVKIGWADCGERTLFSTRDGGVTWANITPHLRDGVVTSAPLTPPLTLHRLQNSAVPVRSRRGDTQSR